MRKLFWLLFLALLIRLISLNQSFWLDEAITATLVRDSSFGQILTQFAPTDFHPPLYYLLMKAWSNIFGYSEIALRIPSVIFSLAAGYVIFLWVGVWAAALFLFNPLIIYYSQEARMYMLVTFLLTLALYGLEKKKYYLYYFGIGLACFTFYGSVFLIVAIMFYLLFNRNWKVFFLTSLTVILTFLLLSPLLYQQWLHSQTILPTVPNWQNALGTVNLKNLLLIPLKFSIGRISFEPKVVYYLLAGGFAALVWLAIMRRHRYFYWLVLTVLLALIFSLFTPLLQYFRFLYLIPVFSVLIAKNTKRFWRLIILAGFVAWSLIYLLIPGFHREDWRELVKTLNRSVPIYGIPSSLAGVNYYAPNLFVFDLRSARPDAKQIQVIPYTFPIYGLSQQQMLQPFGYKRQKQTAFRELVLETWVK